MVTDVVGEHTVCLAMSGFVWGFLYIAIKFYFVIAYSFKTLLFLDQSNLPLAFQPKGFFLKIRAR